MVKVTKSNEPFFDPWNSSVFHVVPAIQRDSSYERQCQSRAEVRPLQTSRHFSTNSTQGKKTENDIGLPALNNKETMTYGIAYPGYPGLVSPRNSSNNYYRRLSGGRSFDEPQTARLADPAPRSNMSASLPGPSPFFRQGKGGAPWRHIRQCTGSMGNHICFVDGAVKQNDMMSYPPYGYSEPKEPTHTYISPRLVGNRREKRGGNTSKYANVYNSHAKSGFEYWPKELTVAVTPNSYDRLVLWAGKKTGK